MNARDMIEDVPRPAAGVEPVGELQGTAYLQSQWLIRRGDRFLQVSELLYRTAELIDGERSVDEIAEELTARTPWRVTPENVVQIVESKLVPLGIVAGRGAAVPVGSPRSPLQLGMRTKMLGPGVIDPVTGVLRHLFRPPILVPVLAAVLGVHAWLYAAAAASLGDAIRQLLHQPLLVAPLFAIVLVAGFVHEFGHAAALRYGGGRVRAMGFGFYLVYPALFTDTSDAYRLGRWARVRVDLGGFYFHLIASTALVVTAFAADASFLLVAVLTINFEVLRQLLFPFVRFDGYWLLADLTGVPDFFSQVGAYLRTAFPRLGGGGGHLPGLRRWAEVVFAAYIALTVPALGGLVYVFATRAPGFVRTGWESLQAHAGTAATAAADGRLADAALAFAGTVILSLPLIGAAYLVSVLARLGYRLARAAVRNARARRSHTGLAAGAPTAAETPLDPSTADAWLAADGLSWEWPEKGPSDGPAGRPAPAAAESAHA